jgi:hypothetical protein
MTNKKATTEILAFGQNDGQEQKQMRGFFAALRMTSERAGVRMTSKRAGVRMADGKQTNAKSPGLRSETWGTQYLGYSDDAILR